MLTPDRYLTLEREAPYRSEYHDGGIFPREPAQEAHCLITVNVCGELHRCFRSRSCCAFTSDMRVRTNERHYVYPDASAVCGKAQFLDEQLDTLVNPTVIVEVLSPSTEAYDRGRKFELYQSIPSLREYLLLASDRVHADLYMRQSNGHWLLVSAAEPEGTLTLESVGCRVSLADLYEKVEFEPALF